MGTMMRKHRSFHFIIDYIQKALLRIKIDTSVSGYMQTVDSHKDSINTSLLYETIPCMEKRACSIK